MPQHASLYRFQRNQNVPRWDISQIPLETRLHLRHTVERVRLPESRLEQRERDMVEAARRGDRAAFAGLVRAYERSALAIAFACTGDGTLAGDIAQEAFIRAWQGIGRLDDPERFRGWLGRIVRNVAADQLRSRQRMRIVQPEDGRQIVDPIVEAGRSEVRGSINDALATLDEISRAVVVLRYYEQLSSKEIGELLDMTPASVDMRLSRARVELKERLRTLDPKLQAAPTLHGL